MISTRRNAALGTVAMTLLVAAALVVPAAGAAVSEGAADGGKTVTVTTEDGMSLAATWWDEPTPGAAGVVLVHGHGATWTTERPAAGIIRHVPVSGRTDRTSWLPLVEHLRARKIEVLAIDLRGHGGSAKQHGVDLAPLVADGDPALFQEMHADAIAAVRWLVKDGKCDAKRIALVGADIGGTIAIDAARRHPQEVAAVADLVPVATFADLDAAAMFRTFPRSAPLLLVARNADAEGASALHKAWPSSRLLVYRADEGTPGGLLPAPPADRPESDVLALSLLGGFRSSPLVEQTVASFVAASTGSRTDDVVLDGIVETAGPDADPWPRATRVDDQGGGKAWAYRVGSRIVFGGIAPKGCAALVIEIDTRRPDPDVPDDLELDLPDAVTIDVERRMTVMHVRRGNGDADAVRATDRTRMGPAYRIVPAPGGATFEGEWTMPNAPAAGDPVRFRIRFEKTVPEHKRPEPGKTVERTLLPSR